MAKYYTYGDPYANTTGTSACTYTNAYTRSEPRPVSGTYAEPKSGSTYSGPTSCGLFGVYEILGIDYSGFKYATGKHERGRVPGE